MTHRIVLYLLALLTLGLAGCGHSTKTAASAPEVLIDSDASNLMAAAQETLGQMKFVLDKYDVEAGYLRTRPQRASQFFEPWRQDNASATAFARANLDSLRRTVEVYVEPQENSANLRCVVSVGKLSLPPQPVKSMARMAGMYTDSSRSQQTLTLDAEKIGQLEWIDMGSDHALEHRIVTQIQNQLRKG
jgi:outer membrane lipopolysaccharide assembly protein LptE/RlpB